MDWKQTSQLFNQGNKRSLASFTVCATHSNLPPSQLLPLPMVFVYPIPYWSPSEEFYWPHPLMFFKLPVSVHCLAVNSLYNGLDSACLSLRECTGLDLFTAIFRCMTLCHYAFTKFLEEENFAEGCSVLSHQPCFFRKLNYLPSINSFGGSHCHGECAPRPTRYEHQAMFLGWPTVLCTILTPEDLFYICYYPRTASIHHGKCWYCQLLIFHQKIKNQNKNKLDKERCKI